VTFFSVRDDVGGLSAVLPQPTATTHFFAMPRREPPVKDWCFTINNPRADKPGREGDLTKVKTWTYNYLVVQLEVGKEGTPHLQGFVQFPTGQRLTQLKKLHKRAHWEPRRGSAYQAAHYCKKPEPECDCQHCEAAADTPRPQLIYESGSISAPAGEKLWSVAQVIKRRGLTAAIDAYPTHYMGMHKGMEALATHYSPQRSWQTVVSVLYGQPETGKTRYAMLGPLPYKLSAFGGKGQTDFFGDYRPDVHGTLVVDDFYGNWSYTTFLQACDRYPTEVHTKGGFRQLLVRHIVFTSNSSPDEWYPKVLANPDRRESFNRRIHNVIFFTKLGYVIKKGNLPWPGLDWLQPLDVNQALMNPHLLNPLPPANVNNPRETFF